MRSVKQKIDKAIEEGRMIRPALYVHDGCEVELWQQRSDSMGEKRLTLEEAEEMGLIAVQRHHYGHGNMSAGLRVWVFNNSVHLWIQPKTTNN